MYHLDIIGVIFPHVTMLFSTMMAVSCVVDKNSYKLIRIVKNPLERVNSSSLQTIVSSFQVVSYFQLVAIIILPWEKY